MGAQDYTHFRQAPTAREAFDELVGRAEAEYGHRQGYAGEIHQADGFHKVMAMTRPDAERRRARDLAGDMEKNGPATCIPILAHEVIATRTVKIKVTAPDFYEAHQRAEAEALRAAAPAGTSLHVAECRTVGVRKPKPPPLTSVRAARAAAYRITNGLPVGAADCVRIEAPTRGAALKKLRVHLIDFPGAAAHGPFKVERVTPIETLTAGRVEQPTFTVAVTVETHRAGAEVTGYLFYGRARS